MHPAIPSEKQDPRTLFTSTQFTKHCGLRRGRQETEMGAVPLRRSNVHFPCNSHVSLSQSGNNIAHLEKEIGRIIKYIIVHKICKGLSAASSSGTPTWKGGAVNIDRWTEGKVRWGADGQVMDRGQVGLGLPVRGVWSWPHPTPLRASVSSSVGLSASSMANSKRIKNHQDRKLQTHRRLA